MPDLARSERSGEMSRSSEDRAPERSWRVASREEPVSLELDGLLVTVVGATAGPNGIQVTLAADESELTRRLDRQYSRKLQEWAARPDSAKGRPPEMPGLRLAPVEVELSDAFGTHYRPTEKSVAGDGSEWEAQVLFSPAPAPAVHTLHVSIRVPVGSEARAVLSEVE